jgi:predicted phosphoribosyltransferase
VRTVLLHVPAGGAAGGGLTSAEAAVLGLPGGVQLVFKVKLAMQLLLALVATDAVVAVPVQSPDQPAKIEPAAGAAVNLTTVPDA